MARSHLCISAALAALTMVPEIRAQTPLPPPSPSLFRDRPVPSGTGFYSRTYNAPGFSPVPSTPNYNSVSFYGRSYRPSGFNPVPVNTPLVGMYIRTYRLPGFAPQTTVQTVTPEIGSTAAGPTVAVPEGFSIAVPEGFTAASDMGSYSTLSYYAPGSFGPAVLGY
jgi:hypothetical protein